MRRSNKVYEARIDVTERNKLHPSRIPRSDGDGGTDAQIQPSVVLNDQIVYYPMHSSNLSLNVRNFYKQRHLYLRSEGLEMENGSGEQGVIIGLDNISI